MKLETQLNLFGKRFRVIDVSHRHKWQELKPIDGTYKARCTKCGFISHIKPIVANLKYYH